MHIDYISRTDGTPSERGRGTVDTLCQCARPGSACLSRAIHDAISGKINASFSAVEQQMVPGQTIPTSFVRMTTFSGDDVAKPSGQETSRAEQSPAPESPSEPVPVPESPRALMAGESGEPSNSNVMPLGADELDATFVWGRADRDGTVLAGAFGHMRTKSIDEREKLADDLIREDKIYEAITTLDEAILAADRHPSMAGTAGQLRERRSLLADRMRVTGNAVIDYGVRRFLLLPGEVISIGRATARRTAPDIELTCQTVSRSSAGLRLVRTEDGLTVERGNAANSVFLDNFFIEMGGMRTLDHLDQGMTISLGGVDDPPSKGDCRRVLKRPSSRESVVICQINLDHLSGVGGASLGQTWSNVQRESEWTWLFLNESFLVGSGSSFGLPVDGLDGEAHARIHYGAEGYQFEAFGDGMQIDRCNPIAKVPLRDGVVLSAGDSVLTFRVAGSE